MLSFFFFLAYYFPNTCASNGKLSTLTENLVNMVQSCFFFIGVTTQSIFNVKISVIFNVFNASYSLPCVKLKHIPSKKYLPEGQDLNTADLSEIAQLALNLSKAVNVSLNDFISLYKANLNEISNVTSSSLSNQNKVLVPVPQRLLVVVVVPVLHHVSIVGKQNNSARKSPHKMSFPCFLGRDKHFEAQKSIYATECSNLKKTMNIKVLKATK